jgi:hypothetical protein
MIHCTKRCGNMTIQEVEYETLDGETKKAVSYRERHQQVTQVSEIVHCTEGYERMAIKQSQGGRKVRRQGLDLTTPETSNATITNSDPVPSELRDVMNKFNIVTYRRAKASLHTMMV